MAAIALSLLNLFHIRQKVIKHAIYITGSNKQYLVKPVHNTLIVGHGHSWVGLLGGLLAVWHIPSIGAESAVRTYLAMEDATTAYLIDGEEICQRALDDRKKRKILAKHGVAVNNNREQSK